ncbi:hypothetical protein P7C73_g2679, partial [Tremellales sp. Uapishka_1]
MLLPSLLPFAVSALLSSTLARAFALSSVPKTTTGSRTVIPNRYIIEFDTAAHESAGINKRASSPHEAIYHQLEARNVHYTLHHSYSSDLFTGASLTLASPNNVMPVSAMQAPMAVSSADSQWKVKSGMTKSNKTSHTSSSGKVSTTTSCTNNKGKKTCTTATITSQPSSTAAAYPTTGFSNLGQIQADRVQATGNKGKGIKVAIVDSGVDYTRTPLGGCFGTGCKIAGGYDFVGDSYDGTNDPVPDSDPFDNCYQHGSIVAGIIGAYANEYNVTGVAPEASIYVYRVFGCNGATSDDIVFEAMERAYTDGADVINLSLDETSGWTEGALSVLASRIVNNGTVVVAAAANQGQVGAFYSQSPAAGVGVISAGSTDNAIYPAQNATVSTGYGPITYFNYASFTSSTYPIYALSTDPSVAADACTIPDNTPDLSGYLVVVRRGGCALSTKAQNLYYQGATAMFVVNYEDTVPLYQNFPLIDFALVSYEDGTYLLDQYAANANTTVTFNFNPVAVPNTYTGNITSLFSEIGPTNDLHLSTTIMTPGTNIIGVVPTTFSNWSITDGTSWSSAFASGSAALYLSAKGNSNASPRSVREALEFSAAQVPVSLSDSTLETVAAQGAGKLHIYDAIYSSTIISPTELLLNDTANMNSVQYITVTNSGTSSVNYKLSNVAAGTALAYQTGLNQSNDEPVPQVSNAASVRFSQSSFSLKPGQSNVITLYFTAPTGLDAKTFPIYSGWIQVAGGSNTVQVPYLGVAAAMKNMPIIDPTPYYLGINTPTLLDQDGNVQTGTQTYTFANGDSPTALYRLVGGTPLLLIDLISANASLGFTPEYTSRRRSASLSDETLAMKRSLEARRAHPSHQSSGNFQSWWYQIWCQRHGKGGNGVNTFNKVPILGNLHEADYIPRDTDNADGEGGDYETFAVANTFTNGTTIPNGTYKLLLRALKITGDISKESDYESWTSQSFTIAQ